MILDCDKGLSKGSFGEVLAYVRKVKPSSGRLYKVHLGELVSVPVVFSNRPDKDLADALEGIWKDSANLGT